jgi:hypothetical protein
VISDISSPKQERSMRWTLVVSNLPFKKWAELMPSEPQAVAIVDRLIDDASILSLFRKALPQSS